MAFKDAMMSMESVRRGGTSFLFEPHLYSNSLFNLPPHPVNKVDLIRGSPVFDGSSDGTSFQEFIIKLRGSNVQDLTYQKTF